MPSNFNRLGPVYPLGKFTINAVGTPVNLDANSGITDNAGIPATGINSGGIINKGTPSPLKCSLLKISTPASNTGNVFLIKKGATAAGNAGLDVILVIQPGQERELPSQQTANPFTLDQYALDTDVNAQVCWVTALIG